MDRTEPQDRFGLAALLSAAGVVDFETFDPERPYLSSGPLQRLGGLARLSELQDPGALFRAWRVSPVRAWPAGGTRAGPIEVAPSELEAAFQSGLTLYFRSVETNVPQLGPLARELERDLFLRPGTMTCEAFASSAGGGARMHFDPNMAFNVQMMGAKTWRIARNTTVANAHMGFVAGGEPDGDLLRYAAGDFPTEMPPDAMTFETDPGSVVYVPHGSWHATETTEVSLALLFVVSQDTWVSLVTRRLAALLRDRPAWREIPIGLQSPAFWRGRRGLVSELLCDLERTVASITAEDMMRTLGGPAVLTYRLQEGVGLKVSRSRDSGWTLTLSQGGRVGSRPIPPELAMVCRWISNRKRRFTGAEAVARLPSSDPGFVLKAIDGLRDRDILVVEARSNRGHHG
jgi:hypothetical protein